MYKNQGFTLIELLVVVLIIGILAAVALPQYTKAVEKSRAAEAKNLLSSLTTAEQSFYLARGTFTNDLSALDIQLPGVGSAQTSAVNTKNFKIMIAEPNYTTLTLLGEGSGTSVSSTAHSIAVEAVRITPAGEEVSGDLGYTLVSSIENGGSIISRRCYGSEFICKSICDGRSCAESNADWCYGGGQSMLAQANQANQSVLQLLQ